MSIQKKPFLKKGTRQFLSNAQVRSQSNKPRIVQYDQNQNENYEQFTFKPPQKNINNQISIPVKVNKLNKTSNTNNNLISQKNAPTHEKKIERNKNSSVEGRSSAKKANNLQDYLDLQQQSIKPSNRKPSVNKKQPEQNNRKIPLPPPKTSLKTDEPTKNSATTQNKQILSQNKQMSLVGMLHKQQDEQQDSQQRIIFQNQSIQVPKTNSLNYHFQNKPSIQVKKNLNDHPIIPKKSNQANIYYQENQLKNSQSDSSQNQNQQNQFITQKRKEQKIPSTGNFNQYLKYKETQQNFQQTLKSANKQSKVQKLFGINKPQPELINTKQKSESKVLTINDIPQQLKNQIIIQQMKENKEQIQNKLKILNQQINAAKKEKSRFQDESRALNKAKIQFEKSMEEKQKQFEEKMKAENKKLNVEKKYRKEIQTTSKEDWKFKAELQQTKKQLEQVLSEKKKSQNKYKIEVQRLKKRLQEQIQKNKMLTQQVKLLEYGKLIQKEIVKENSRDIAKRPNTTSNKNDYWVGAPKKSYIQRFLDEDFSLIQFPKQYYQFDSNEYYRFYTRIKDQASQLEQQTTQNDKVKRIYQNGKIQQEYYNKLLKEIFPFKYTVIHHVNGDVKQILPEGIIIYFDKTNENVEFKITPDKKIIFFCKNGQAQLHWDTPKGKIVECYNGKILKRILPDGRSEYLSNVQDGQIFHLRGQ